MSLGGNTLIGTIPPAIGNLTDLTTLNMSDNQLSGNIPIELGNLTNLLRLNLSTNQLGGPIPDSLSSLTQLTQLYLHNNDASLCVSTADLLEFFHAINDYIGPDWICTP